MKSRLAFITGSGALAAALCALPSADPAAQPAQAGPVCPPPVYAGGPVDIKVDAYTVDRVSLDSENGNAEIVTGPTSGNPWLCKHANSKNNAHPSMSDVMASPANTFRVAWATEAPRVAGQNNFGEHKQVYACDVEYNAGFQVWEVSSTILISGLFPSQANPTGMRIPGDAFSDFPAVSADGRFVALTSKADLPGNTKNKKDVFLHEIDMQDTTRVSENPDTGKNGNRNSGGVSGISPCGRWVVFSSFASNLDNTGLAVVPNKRASNVYRLDREALPVPELRWISVGEESGVLELPEKPASLGTQQADSGRPSISADGSLVAFDSWAQNLTPEGGGDLRQTYLWDASLGGNGIRLVSRSVNGGSAEAEAWRAQVSSDGQWVVYESTATDLDSLQRPDDDIDSGPCGTPTPDLDVFVTEVATLTDPAPNTERISIFDPGGMYEMEFPPGHCKTAVISGDGRFVFFTFVPTDGAQVFELWACDRDDHELRRIGQNPMNVPPVTGWSGGYPLGISRDGKHVAFMSEAPDYLAGGLDTNGVLPQNGLTTCGIFGACLPEEKPSDCPERYGRDIYFREVW